MIKCHHLSEISLDSQLLSKVCQHHMNYNFFIELNFSLWYSLSRLFFFFFFPSHNFWLQHLNGFTVASRERDKLCRRRRRGKKVPFLCCGKTWVNVMLNSQSNKISLDFASDGRRANQQHRKYWIPSSSGNFFNSPIRLNEEVLWVSSRFLSVSSCFFFIFVENCANLSFFFFSLSLLI